MKNTFKFVAFALIASMALGAGRGRRGGPPVLPYGQLTLGQMLQLQLPLPQGDKQSRDLEAQARFLQTEIGGLQQPVKGDAELAAYMDDALYGRSANTPWFRDELATTLNRDPEKRGVLLREAQDQADAIKKQLAPYQQAAAAAQQQRANAQRAYGPAFAAALARYLHDPDGFSHDQGRASASTVSYNWLDKGQTICTLSLSLSPAGNISYTANDERFEGKFPIGTAPTPLNPNLENHAVAIRAGLVYLNLSVNRPSLAEDSDQMLQMLKSLIDLDAIAALKPEPLPDQAGNSLP